MVKHLNSVTVDIAHIVDNEPVLFILHLCPLDVEVDFLANHHLGKNGFRSLRGVYRADILTFSENGNLVGNFHNLVELMRDNDDGLVVSAHITQNVEKLLRLLRSEHGGRLVKNQNIGAPVKHLDNLDRLLFRDRHLIYLFVKIKLKAITVKNFLNFCRGLFHIKFAVIITENDVFCRRKDINKLEMLMYHSDLQIKSVLGRSDNDLFTVNKDLTVIREIDTRNHIHQRCFTASVLTENREDLSPVDGEVDVLVGDNRAKGLCYVFKFNSNLCTHLMPSKFLLSKIY